MSPFSMFALLYMTAYFVEVDPAGHEAQGMQGQIFALASVLVITIIILTGITRVKFLVFLILATAILLIDRFPDVPNHVNIMIYFTHLTHEAGSAPGTRKVCNSPKAA
jgi:hypothetical protein